MKTTKGDRGPWKESDRLLEYPNKEYKVTINIALQQEQQQRLREGLAISQDQVSEEAELNTDRYSLGYFDGLIGEKPSNPEQHSYWAGYQIGSREYWAKKLGVVIPTEF